MSEAISKLGASIQITEWVDPRDPRSSKIAREPLPEAGGALRETWELDGAEEEQQAARLVRGLIVPCRQLLIGSVAESFNRRIFRDGPDLGEGQGNVELDFTHIEDWRSCMPVHETAGIFRDDEGMQAWAAIALCKRTIGLSVFAKEQAGGGVHARIQRVPEDALRQF